MAKVRIPKMWLQGTEANLGYFASKAGREIAGRA